MTVVNHPVVAAAVTSLLAWPRCGGGLRFTLVGDETATHFVGFCPESDLIVLSSRCPTSVNDDLNPIGTSRCPVDVAQQSE